MTQCKFNFSLFILALTFVMAASLPVFAGQTVTVKSGTSLNGDYVRVGDIFDNAGEYANHPLAPTPDIGKSLDISQSDMMRIAKTFQFDWQPDATTPTSISFTRNATRLDLDSIKEILNDSDLASKVNSDFDIYFDNGTRPIDIKGTDVVSFSTQNISYNPITERFSATIYCFNAAQDIIGQSDISGKAVRMITVPTLSNRLRRNDIISANDIVPLRIREKDLNTRALIDEQDIIGMQARRVLSPQTPLIESDLAFPTLVRKNDLVTITLSNGPMSLTAKGRSLSDGAKGDTISVMNSSSKKVVEAIVVSQGNAIVPTNAQQFN